MIEEKQQLIQTMNISNVSKGKSDKQTIILDNDNVSVSVCKERKVFKFKVKVINDPKEISGAVFIAKIKDFEKNKKFSFLLQNMDEITKEFKEKKDLRVDLAARTLTIEGKRVSKNKTQNVHICTLILSRDEVESLQEIKQHFQQILDDCFSKEQISLEKVKEFFITISTNLIEMIDGQMNIKQKVNDWQILEKINSSVNPSSVKSEIRSILDSGISKEINIQNQTFENKIENESFFNKMEQINSFSEIQNPKAQNDNQNDKIHFDMKKKLNTQIDKDDQKVLLSQLNEESTDQIQIIKQLIYDNRQLCNKKSQQIFQKISDLKSQNNSFINFMKKHLDNPEKSLKELFQKQKYQKLLKLQKQNPQQYEIQISLLSKCQQQQYSNDYIFDGRQLKKLTNNEKSIFIILQEIPLDKPFVFKVTLLNVNQKSSIGLSRSSNIHQNNMELKKVNSQWSLEFEQLLQKSNPGRKNFKPGDVITVEIYRNRRVIVCVLNDQLDLQIYADFLKHQTYTLYPNIRLIDENQSVQLLLLDPSHCQYNLQTQIQ